MAAEGSAVSHKLRSVRTLHKLFMNSVFKIELSFTLESLYFCMRQKFNYLALMVWRIHAEFGAILSYIRGRSMPVGAHAIRHEAMPTNAH